MFLALASTGALGTQRVQDLTFPERHIAQVGRGGEREGKREVGVGEREGLGSGVGEEMEDRKKV